MQVPGKELTPLAQLSEALQQVVSTYVLANGASPGSVEAAAGALTTVATIIRSPEWMRAMRAQAKGAARAAKDQQTKQRRSPKKARR